jgi:hypothetical protein
MGTATASCSDNPIQLEVQLYSTDMNRARC